MKLLNVYQQIANVSTSLAGGDLTAAEARDQIKEIVKEANDKIKGLALKVPTIAELEARYNENNYSSSEPEYEESYESSVC